MATGCKPACEIARLFDEVVHECVESKRTRSRRSEGLHEGGGPFGQILPIGDFEAGRGYVAAQLFIGCEEAPFAAIGPRKGVVDRPGLSLDDVPDRQPPAGHKHPTRFLVETPLMGDVHLDVLTYDHVKLFVAEGQRRHVTLTDCYQSIESYQTVEPLGDLAILVAHFDGLDSATVGVGEEASRSSDPASGVKYRVGRCHPRLGC
jgi:hypothetical protein